MKGEEKRENFLRVSRHAVALQSTCRDTESTARIALIDLQF